MNAPVVILLVCTPLLLPAASGNVPDCGVSPVAYYPEGVSPTSEATVKTVFEMSDLACVVTYAHISVMSSDGTRSGGEVEVYGKIIIVTFVTDPLPVGIHSVSSSVHVASVDNSNGNYAGFNFAFRTIAA